MAWRHYEVRGAGDVPVVIEETGAVSARYTTGIVSTGKTRVFAGYFVGLVLPSGTEFTSEDEHSLRRALVRLASNLSAVLIGLQCAGLDPRWQESGLSENSGYGYFTFYPEAVHMLAPVPPMPDRDDAIDRLIVEAVNGMRIGWCSHSSQTSSAQHFNNAGMIGNHARCLHQPNEGQSHAHRPT